MAREGEHRELGSRGVDGKAARVAVLARERKNQSAGKIMDQRDKPRLALNNNTAGVDEPEFICRPLDAKFDRRL
jgi:hypothetical protein